MPGPPPTTEHLFGSLRLDDGHVLLSLVGEIDIATVDRCRALVEASVAVEPKHITIDLSGIDYMGLCAVPLFENAALRMSSQGGRVTLRNVSSPALRLIEACGLAKTLEITHSDSDAGVVRGLAAAGQVPADRLVLDAALKLVVTMAQAVVVGADGVSITLPRHGKLATVAASNEVVLAMDHDQYDTGQGPCLDAARQGESFQFDARSEDVSWPDFAPRARARGIQSILSTPLLSASRPIGALNIYSRSSDAFAMHEREWADQFATEAAAVVTTAEAGATSERLNEQLLDALKSRHTIAMAQGMFMERHGGSAADAYASLREASRESSRPLRQVCDELLTARAGAATDGSHGSVHVEGA